MKEHDFGLVTKLWIVLFLFLLFLVPSSCAYCLSVDAREITLKVNGIKIKPTIENNEIIYKYNNFEIVIFRDYQMNSRYTLDSNGNKKYADSLKGYIVKDGCYHALTINETVGIRLYFTENDNGILVPEYPRKDDQTNVGYMETGMNTWDIGNSNIKLNICSK